MPILEFTVVLKAKEALVENTSAGLAEAAARVLQSDPGRKWVKPSTLSHEKKTPKMQADRLKVSRQSLFLCSKPIPKESKAGRLTACPWLERYQNLSIGQPQTSISSMNRRQ